jgi:hypothetical protein
MTFHRSPHAALAFLLAGASLLAACGGGTDGAPAPATGSACATWSGALAPGTLDPAAAVIETSDLDRFAAVLEAQPPGLANLEAALDAGYLGPGTPALREFTAVRLCNASALAQAVRTVPSFYRTILPQLRSLSTGAAAGGAIREAFARLAAIYPRASFAPTTFVVGRLNTAGTIGKSGLLIGAEFLGDGSGVDRTGLNAGFVAGYLHTPAEAPIVVSHEQVHVQQRQAGALMAKATKTLLDQALMEGAADFVGEIASGGNLNASIHAWAAPREAEIWRDFASQMQGTDVSRWLYNQGSATPDRPGDLGYYVGYRICASYFDRMSDKVKAVSDIVEMGDGRVFLDASGYAARFPP